MDGCRSLRQCASVTTVMMQSHVRQWHQYADATVTAADLIVTRTNAVKASSAQWALVERLRTLMPNARVTLRVHKLTWKRDTRLPALITFGLLATLEVRPFSFRREFEAPAAPQEH